MADKVYGVSYVTIDGKKTKPENMFGYCKAHKGILTYPLARLHRCQSRKDGQPCMHFIKFERYDNRYESALKGEEFRQSLGKKGKKSERKRRKAPDTGSAVAEVPDCTSKDYTFGRMEQAGDLPSVSEDSRLETDGVRNKFDKDRCNKCFWRKMFCRVVRTYVCAGNKWYMKGEQMLTRSTITFRERGCEPVVRVRKHFDGYIEGLGHSLAKWLVPMKLINGICNDEQYRHDYANGIGCLAAKWIADVKTKTGDIYLDCGCEEDEDYNYEVILEPHCLSYDGTPTDECITIEVRKFDKEKPIFKGTPSELLKFEEKFDDEDE